ncbi:response regulator receiver domain protein [Ichthyophthirius multifiliis]|uniref:Response regulator receiver domain protein n=1 Tax=Ichthyophthirius multifiliis TaxID=5932 RepID=G0R1V2_ICHMU|nr:response regulator receiver domain protein [Ichthyophthirius multifiliis]EGR28561.1 response regulator receiver domain protein [Ichthyophthirius multifiliis]|eukprot:XP_004029797.1 response regulator receiver domain protein [Ichthyophthirius multifiliis]
MPIMNGHESIKLIRQFEKEFNINPSIIIVNSANINQDDIQQSVDCGADQHIAKPVDTQNLRQLLQKYAFAY